MQLITEFIDSEYILDESTKNWYIEGIYMQAEVRNKNNRTYPLSILEREVNKYVDQYVTTGRALGELNHPQSPTVNPDRVSHRVVMMERQGNDFIGKSLVLNTPKGNLVKGLLEGGTQIGVSSRGLGTVKAVNGINEVQQDFEFKCMDIVVNPSAPSAFVDGIMEGVEYYYKDGVLHEEEIERIKKEVQETSTKDLFEKKLAIFKRVMGSV